MRKNAKKTALALSAAALLLTIGDAHSWCWKRENATTTEGCSAGYTEKCCDGALEKWVSDTDTVVSGYRISTSTAPARVADVEAGFSRWNDIEMSTFRFERGSDTAVWGYGQDGINLINVDSQFCTHYPEYCGVGILGFSMVYTRDTGDTYKATEGDIILNAEDFVYGPEGSTALDAIDTVAVVAHEAGHNAGLSHAGGICRGSGSAGCGAEAYFSTMYYAYDVGVPTDKATLELDDVAAMVAGYPRAKFRVKVVDSANGNAPLAGVKVTVNGTAFPVEVSEGQLDAYGVSYAGGYVIGDLASADTRFGNGASSGSYVGDADHFTLTGDDGYTDYRIPVTKHFNIKATLGMASATAEVTDVTTDLVGGQKTIQIALNSTTLEDFGSPALAITSHEDGQLVATNSITLRGTASDAGFGDHGISSVTVNGVRALNDVALNDGVAEWAKTLTLAEGSNRIEVVANDDSSTPQWNAMTKVIAITCDTTAPEVVETSPEAPVIDPDPEEPLGGVDPDAQIVFAMQFSEKLDPSTVNSTTVRLSYQDDGETVYAGGQPPVYDADTKVVTFIPDTTLGFSRIYTLTATTGITDIAGNPLAEDFVFRISTRAPSGNEPPPSNGGNQGAGMPNTSGQGSCFMDTLFERF